MISLAENEMSDVGYCTGPSSKDTQGQTSNGYHQYSQPIQGKTSILPIVTVKKKAPSTNDLSQPTLEEHQIVSGWALQSKEDHCYNSGSLSQDLAYQGQPLVIADNSWIPPKHRIQKKLLYNIDYIVSRDSPNPVQPSVTDKDKNRYPEPAADGWPPLFKQHCRVIMRNLNMRVLLPHLIENNLLTQEEYQELNCNKVSPERDFLLSVLPRKGKNAFTAFLNCLKAEEEHMGHQELVELLCV